MKYTVITIRYDCLSFRLYGTSLSEWSRSDSNRQPPTSQVGALPLRATTPKVDPVGFKPTAFSLQGSCSVELNYGPEIERVSMYVFPLYKSFGSELDFVREVVFVFLDDGFEEFSGLMLGKLFAFPFGNPHITRIAPYRSSICVHAHNYRIASEQVIDHDIAQYVSIHPYMLHRGIEPRSPA